MGDCGADNAPFVLRRGVATQPSHHMDSMRKRGKCQGKQKKMARLCGVVTVLYAENFPKVDAS